MRILIWTLFLLAVPVLVWASDITFTGDCSDGCATSEDWLAANANEIKTAVDDNDARLDNLGTCSSSPCDLATGTTVNSASIQTGTDDDVPESGDFGAAADLDADGSLSAGSVDAAEVAADVATQAELDAKSAATSTDNALARYNGTTGDVQDSQTREDDSGNVTISGSVIGDTRVNSRTSSATLSSDDMKCSVVTNDGAGTGVTFTLPEATVGACVTIVLAEANSVDIDPQGAIDCSLGVGCDQIIGETDQAGEKLSSGATTGTLLSLVGITANEWIVTGKAGTWTEESP